MTSRGEREARPSDVIVEAFRELCLRHGLTVESRNDDPVLGSYVVFKGTRSALTVDYENRGYSAWFDQYEGGVEARKLGLNRILDKAGQGDAVSYSARDMLELYREMRKLASLCEIYAVPAIKGDASFYDRYD